ncbi:SgcJ/EcaC family oxidoreductase [Nonomuraea sp. MCN248]|uniref:SgcJ/EcaC family oxidoreductase n=1 Tax=Nonomuraea corallina TaxID=2989783 RepID=A0ABT4S597_9ACTN|nr:SgcJ/EcaC family oxidoreductase [Nonomuraea corallina]MDA0632195.1 SgcJ/EcaC family oxidoreductase [Nonomuraea corallina]
MSAEIRQLLDRVFETWNAGDAAAYAALFTEDADYITYFGFTMKGRQAIEDGHRQLFTMPIKLERRDEPAIRMLGDGVALVIATGGSTVDGEPDPDRDSVLGYTAVRTPEGWRFASFQNTRAGRP